MQYLRHGGTCYISALFRKTALGQITSCVLGISHIHIGNNIHNPAVCLLRQTLVLATVSGFHVKDRNMQTLGRDSRQAGIGIPENQQCIGLYLCRRIGGNLRHGIRMESVPGKGTTVYLTLGRGDFLPE